MLKPADGQRLPVLLLGSEEHARQAADAAAGWAAPGVGIDQAETWRAAVSGP